MIFIQIPKIMKNEEAEAKVVAYKIARDLDGTSPVVGLKALMMFLVALVCHSKNPKRTADFIIGGLKRAVEEANDDRNLVDLSKIWHDASEEPRRDEYLLGEDNDGFSIYMWRRQEEGWNLFVGITTLRRWAYIDDLLPKGGEK